MIKQDIILISRGSNVSIDVVNLFAKNPSSFVLANRIILVIKQKEKDFLACQNLNNIKNNTKINTQNNGLR